MRRVWDSTGLRQIKVGSKVTPRRGKHKGKASTVMDIRATKGNRSGIWVVVDVDGLITTELAPTSLDVNEW